MRQDSARTVVGSVLVLALTVSTGAAQEGWIPLFNGRDLSGWKKLGGSAPFHVEDGAIVGTFVADPANTFLTTEQTFGDFVLEFEFRIEAGVNSGVQFRSLSTPEILDGRVHGYQYEIDPSERGFTGGIYDEARRGWVYPVTLNPPARRELKTGVWHTGRIECVGTAVRTWLNDQPVAHLIDDATARGFVALQVHGVAADAAGVGRTVRWRNLRIRTDPRQPSPPDELFIRNLRPNELSAAERTQGWELLFDGRTTAGWRGAQRAPFPRTGWVVRDGMLVVRPADGGSAAGAAEAGGDLVTERTFAAFELQFEFWLTPGANSGVKYYVVAQAADTGHGTITLGPEYQILDDERHPDAQLGVGGNRTLASLYDLVAAARTVDGQGVPRSVGAWNHGRIIANPDGRIEHWLNGYRVLVYERGSESFAALVAASKFRDIPDFGQAARGPILLQDHGDEVRFRSLKVRVLAE
ncbi:MAG: DUF1080 domain-containing protein [Phycisphaerales bacterium]|nr:DUF1080 domain-containing protein [Phycisphaerales bacterium]